MLNRNVTSEINSVPIKTQNETICYKVITLPNFTGVDLIPRFIKINGFINTRFVETNVSVHGKSM